MLWSNYVFRRGRDVHVLWDQLFGNRKTKILYIAGRGFDVRSQHVMRNFASSMQASGRDVTEAKLVLVGFKSYVLDEDISQLTEDNASALEALFSPLGSCSTIMIGDLGGSEEDISVGNALRAGIIDVLNNVTDQTDIILDVSSLPRVVYLSILISLLDKILPKKNLQDGISPLVAGGVNFQVLVGEDAALDGRIQAEDPSNDITFIPGFSGALHAESVQDWPLVWFPILGEGRVGQLNKIMEYAGISNSTEICPVLPHPSRNPRRADDLLVEYKEPLFDSRQTPVSNILYVHESNPFEAYRQLLSAMRRYQHSMTIMGGCRLVVTPLASKLITLGAGLACFEMKPPDFTEKYGVAIPHAEPTRYVAPIREIQNSKPQISALLLTGTAYSDT